MSTTDNYIHEAINSLPTSLRQPEANTFAAIALMQRKAGLNRDRRRELKSGISSLFDSTSKLVGAKKESETRLLTNFICCRTRFINFWKVVASGGPGSPAYALAIDVQLLNAYEPDWREIFIDDDFLVACCSEWPVIKSRLLKGKDKKVAQYLGVFMLWPRIVAELKRWNDVDAERRLQLGHAVFALSSIGFSDWFVNEAVRLCPELSKELKINQSDVKLELPANKAIENAVDLPNASEGVQQATSDDWRQNLDVLVARLDEVSSVLKLSPSRSAVGELELVCKELKLLSARMPDDADHLLEQVDGRIAELIAWLGALTEQNSFEWLDSQIVLQVEARWNIAAAGVDVVEEINALLTDATAAMQRGKLAAQSYLTGTAERDNHQLAVNESNDELAIAKTLQQRRLIERQRTARQQALIDTDAALHTLQDELLSAVSPYAQTFDHERNYCELLAGEQQPQVEQELMSAQPAPVVSVDVLASLIEPMVECLESYRQFSTDVEPPASCDDNDIKLAKELSAPESTVIELPPEMQIAPVRTVEVMDIREASIVATLPSENGQVPNLNQYTVDTGDVCTPMWTLLREGHLSLAYQFAIALKTARPDVKLPPLELLQSVVLSHALYLPDGSVQQALAVSLANLASEPFVNDGPRRWLTALNLLLAAATLRPMVLVPGTGASTVAGYLHLDGKYKELYDLIQELRRFSVLLQGFRIEPTTLKLARSEAAVQDEMHGLQREAQDWLQVQAPAVTIKFAAATKVWKHWLRPQGVISQLVSPIVHNRVEDLIRVKELIASVSDADQFQRRVRNTDRKELKRTTGEDIFAGALEHVARCTSEAVELARRWVTLVDVQGQGGDRMRTLLQEVRKELTKRQPAVEQELRATDEGDDWSLIASAQAVVLRELQATLSLFDPLVKLSPAELAPRDVLLRDLFLVPDINISESWHIDMDPDAVVRALSMWANEPINWQSALTHRIRKGDLFGAEIVKTIAIEEENQSQTIQAQFQRESDAWRFDIRRLIDECRRDIEVGSAYGYLTNSHRAAAESELVRIEAQVDQMRRFDTAKLVIEGIRAQVMESRTERTKAVRSALDGTTGGENALEGIAEVERVLAQGDIATANELVQRLLHGLPVWPESELTADRFTGFFPKAFNELEHWLESQRNRVVVETAIRQGQTVPALEFHCIAGAQREQAAKMYELWSDLKSRKRAEVDPLKSLLTNLGLTVQHLRMEERHPNRETWLLDAEALSDRNICAVPQFGSSARGKYRLVCVWERPTEDDIIRWVGDSTLQRATLVLYFGRMTERKWRETARLAKSKRKSFLLIDEVMLVYLCAQGGSRLSALFDLALPFAYSTPYDATAGLVPPEMFYGRNAELDAVRGLNGRCFIYGGRQLGKTALLRRAEQSFHAPSSGRYSRWIDLRAEGIGVSRRASELWVTLTEQLKSINVFDSLVPVPSPSKKGSLDLVLVELRRFLSNDSDRRILLLLDEADRFFELDGRNDFAETRRLKQLMDDTGRRFKVVFAGLHNVLRMTERANHPLAHFGEPIKIGPLVEEHEVREAEELVRRPMAAAGFEFENRSLAIRVLAQTNYYPSLIQLYCSHLLRHMLAKLGGAHRPIGPRYCISDRDIEVVYSSGELRDEIRSKFRLTLQLDPRYEVVAYALALEALRGRYPHNYGMDWQTIRQAGAMHWWPEGFHDTSELDFRVLLDEMVELGVLSRVRDGWYTLRNPNVLLLLGSEEEIEAVLVKDREPSVEFESAVFRPPMRTTPGGERRNALTYQQLSELLRPGNSVSAIAGSKAGGIQTIVSDLRDYVGQGGTVIELNECTDRAAFTRALDQALKARTMEGNTLMVVPSHVPWSALWVQDACKKLGALRSESRFASLVFLADPMTLWSAMCDDVTFKSMGVPWMTLMPWRDQFVRHWLEELQLPNEPELREKISQVTGCWASMLQDLTHKCTEAAELHRRVAAADLAGAGASNAPRIAKDLGLHVHAPLDILKTLALWGEPAEPSELATVSECAQVDVERVLRWAELLGLVRRQGTQFWSLDSYVKVVVQTMGTS